MNFYKFNSIMNDIKAIQKGRFLERLWNKFIWRNGAKILRKFMR
jgi:hypothetical protein